MTHRISVLMSMTLCCSLASVNSLGEDAASGQRQAQQWRAEHRIIDLHQHVAYNPQQLTRAIRIMDTVASAYRSTWTGMW